MKKITILIVLAFIVIIITACGKMGELERVKSSSSSLGISSITQII
ncbi:hypothetical protein [Candidatus Vesicomyidisocius calyptogenae]|nr:hypothetical protein [Candidatus Vesicomyosocius okutanii]